MPGSGGAEHLNKGTWKWGLDFSFRDGDELAQGSHKLGWRQRQLDVKNRWTRLTYSLEHAITDRFSLRGEIPFVENARTEGYRGVSYVSSGIGDMAISGKYWLNTWAPSRWSFYADLGLTLPTGQDDERVGGFKLSAQREYRKAYIQTGSGTLNPVIALGATRSFGDLTLSGRVSRLFVTGMNSAEYRAADPFMLNLSASHTTFRFGGKRQRMLGGMLAADYIRVENRDRAGVATTDGREKHRSRLVSNTGGWWWNVGPGIFFSPDGGKTMAYVAVSYNVDFHVNSLQCIERKSILMGMSQRF